MQLFKHELLRIFGITYVQVISGKKVNFWLGAKINLVF